MSVVRKGDRQKPSTAYGVTLPYQALQEIELTFRKLNTTLKQNLKISKHPASPLPTVTGMSD